MLTKINDAVHIMTLNDAYLTFRLMTNEWNGMECDEIRWDEMEAISSR